MMAQHELNTQAPLQKKSPNSGFCGVWAPALTPVQSDFSIDNQRLVEHLQWLLNNGCMGVVLFGTTGEAASFSARERMDALETVLNAGISPEKIVVGNGFPSITDTIAVTRHALDQGCNAVLMVPPYFFKEPTDEGLAIAYRHVFDEVNSTKLRVLLYHYPRMSAVPISFGLVDLLLESHLELIAGMKDSSGDWRSIEGFIERYENLAIFPGSDEHLLQGLLSGGAGTITATADVNPTGIRTVYDAWSKGQDAQHLQNYASSIRKTIFQYPLSAALKEIHAHHRNEPAWRRVRPPLVELSNAQRNELIPKLGQLEFKPPGI